MALSLESEIPEGHPQKGPIERALRDLLTGLPGPWKASITRARTGYWWAIRVEGPGVDWTMVLDAKDQNPGFIHSRVGAVLWAGGFATRR